MKVEEVIIMLMEEDVMDDGVQRAARRIACQRREEAERNKTIVKKIFSRRRVQRLADVRKRKDKSNLIVNSITRSAIYSFIIKKVLQKYIVDYWTMME